MAFLPFTFSNTETVTMDGNIAIKRINPLKKIKNLVIGETKTSLHVKDVTSTMFFFFQNVF